MTPLSVIITIAAYFTILFTVSYIAGRKADNAGFFVGNRKSSWYVVAFAMVGSAISGVTYVSVPGMVAASSFGYLQNCRTVYLVLREGADNAGFFVEVTASRMVSWRSPWSVPPFQV